MRQVDAFVKYVLGIDLRQNNMPYRGLFGDVKAYFGWWKHRLLNNCPLKSTAVERVLESTDGKRFREQVASYARRIVTHNLPIEINKCGCSECVHRFPVLLSCQFQTGSQKKPFVIQEVNVHELSLPNLHYYNVVYMALSLSSQQFLRSALARLRPSCRPDWDHVLSEKRSRTQSTKEAIPRREL
ncbi:hypothetical protein GQ600_8959 [Phytophthora cactorum]|nr:hypothetical protein GQ600_8959 [Phytophthora cactorum]